MMKASIVICIYNEEASIQRLLDQVYSSLKAYDYELILVDDGSTDLSVKEIMKGKRDRTTLIELSKNYGQSSALAAGIEQANGEYIVTMDGDLQNDPADIPRMLELAESGSWDLVAGYRGKRQDPPGRKIPSQLANFMIRRLTRIKIRDFGCTLKVFRNGLAKNIGLYGELHRFIPVLAHLEGASITEMEVVHHPREFGKSKYGVGRTFKVISDLLLILFLKKYMQRPMHLFGTTGILTLLAGVIINLYLFFLKISGHDIWGKPLLMLGILLIIGGIQLITIGIFAELLMRTYYESQQKRPYRIKRIHA